MSLCDALRIQPDDIVAFVGAGGKTTAIMKLAGELAGRDRRVLITTTTKIMEPVPAPDERLLLADTLPEATEKIPKLFDEAPIVILAHNRLGNAQHDLLALGKDYPLRIKPVKLEGIPVEWIGALSHAGLADVILIEADGAAHHMLKVPNLHEPVLPPETTLVIPMADTEVLGKTLEEKHVHRSALLADLAGVPLGQSISPEILAIALAHPQGGMKDIPKQARVIPLLTTHAPPDPRSLLINQTVRALLLCSRISHVVVAYLRANPIRWMIFTR